MFKIEAFINGHWYDDAVGNPNEFETREEAAAAIPELARIFQCDERELRVIEV
jgi:hypothetical protein